MQKTMTITCEQIVAARRSLHNELPTELLLLRAEDRIGYQIVDQIEKMYLDEKIKIMHRQYISTSWNLVQSIIQKIVIGDGAILCMFNVEWVIFLVRALNLDMHRIFFVDDAIDNPDGSGKIRSIKSTALVKLLGFPKENIIRFDPDRIIKDAKMKFDYILANPPYQDPDNKAKNNKLWHKIVKKICSPQHLNDNGFVGIICPKSIFEHSVGIGEWFKSAIDNKIFSLRNATVHESQVFAGVSIETCDFLVRLGEHDSIEIPEVGDELNRSILQKMVSYSRFLPIVEENVGLFKNDAEPDGEFEVYQSGMKTFRTSNVDPNTIGRLKIVFPFSSSYTKQFITTQPTCQFNKVMYVESEEQARNIMSFTLSMLYRFFAAKYKKTAGFTPAVKNSMLPMLDYSRSWTDDEIFNFFGISQEERALIESSLPKKKK